MPSVRPRTGPELTIAIAGNPNSGKTSIFNRLTGMTQSVANYPGVTVERKVGRLAYEGRAISVVDLPGTYSLTAYATDERIARDFLLESRPNVVIDVVDASNLERNLYLTVQLLEMRAPLVVALNMVDLARRRGLVIDVVRLSALLGVPVVETVGSRGLGLGDLLSAAVAVAERPESQGTSHPISYGHEVDAELDRLCDLLARKKQLASHVPLRWLALKLLEGDAEFVRLVRTRASDPAAIEHAVRHAGAAIERHSGESAATIIAERRYGYASGIVRECVRSTAGARKDTTDTIDAVVCNRVLGPLILLGVVYGLFVAVFKVGDEWPWLLGRSPTGWVEWLFSDVLARLVDPLRDSMPLVHSLVHEGLIGGVGGVLSFVPLIALLFLFVAILEDSGYVARVAFVLDRLLRVFGLQGKSILAMIVSGGLGAGGCAVPGIMATRTLRDEKDRLITMLVVPLMNCGAKVPVYLMLIGAFFAGHKPLVLFLLWALSWTVSLSAAFLLRRLLFRGEQTPFVMELPPYHLPTLRGVWLHAWERTWMYLKKAGTVILAVNIVIWAAMSFPRLDAGSAALAGMDPGQRAKARLRHSIAGRIGSALAPLSRAAGFEWRDNVALLGGFAAKEVIVGTLGTAYAMDDATPDSPEPLSQRLAADPGWSPLRAVAMMVFVMVYAPCSTTMVMIRRESGKWRWAIFTTAYSTALAFLLAAAVYQIGTLVGF